MAVLAAPELAPPDRAVAQDSTGGGAGSGHLHQIDIVRLLTFAAVIGVHAIAFTEQPSSRAWAGVLMLLQFGREVFFALTGFLLVHAARGRPIGAWSFWRRRFPYVAVPYVAWSVIYTAFHVWGPAHGVFSWRGLATDLVTGNSEYHLYFLLVTMQLYLVFPLLLRFVRKTASRAGLVLGVVGALNLAWLAALQYGHPPAGWPGLLWPRAYELLPTYAVYVLGGAYAALHLDRIERVVARRAGALLGVAAGAAILAEAAFLAQVGGRSPRAAAAVLQPAMLLSSIAAVLVLYLAGSRWANSRRRPAARIVETASDLSFAVYLAHPLVLEVLLRNGLGNDHQRLPALLATVVAALGTAAGAAVIGLIARRSRLSLPLTGRSRSRPVIPKEPRSPVPGGSQLRSRR
jgi:peptidoglycan/LPS O-acetylase OafA/YrhL